MCPCIIFPPYRSNPYSPLWPCRRLVRAREASSTAWTTAGRRSASLAGPALRTSTCAPHAVAQLTATAPLAPCTPSRRYVCFRAVFPAAAPRARAHARISEHTCSCDFPFACDICARTFDTRRLRARPSSTACATQTRAFGTATQTPLSCSAARWPAD